jgi:hypothetical protein
MFGLFVIEAGSEPRAVLDREGKPLVFTDGSSAAHTAQMLSQGLHWANYYEALKCQPRRLASDAWKARELGRFADGTYISLPWTDLPTLTLTAEHFAHVSTEDGARIAYTQDAAKGAGDIQTRVKPGRYLAQFYGDVFDAPTIARMAAEFDTQHGESLVLQFADTEDEIERVYLEGPSSCMSKALHYYSSPVHPVRIYAAGDLAVAYLVRNNEITARALCWPAKKIYGRIYGDETRLGDLLDSASFSAGELDGARMLRIEHRGKLVMPYIDECQCASDDGEHLILGGRGLNGGNTNGLSDPTMCCEACGTDLDEDDAHHNDDGEAFCDCCYSERYSYCERYDETCDAEGAQEVICTPRYSSRRTTQTWGSRAIENEAFECEGNGSLYSNEFLVTLADGTQWSQDYFEDNGTVCEGTSGVTVDGKLYDKSDAPEADETEDADETEEAEVVAPVHAYHWRPSPYFASTAQLEMPLTRDTTRGITVGSYVICNAFIEGQFHVGGRYFVTRVSGERISVACDDSGTDNGWMLEHFRLADDFNSNAMVA